MKDPLTSQPRRMRQYWDEKISWWASSSYEERPRGPVEQLMAHLRRSVHARAVIALEMLRPHLEGRTVVDVGCGNGHFLHCCLEAGAARGVGIDISPAAIEEARQLSQRHGTADRTEWHVGRAGDGTLPPGDFVTGFGLVDWLERDECMAFFKALTGRYFVFSFSEMDGSFDEWVHYFYLIKRLEWFGNGVRAYHHPRKTILGRLKRAGLRDVRIVERPEMRFGRLVHNLHLLEEQ